MASLVDRVLGPDCANGAHDFGDPVLIEAEEETEQRSGFMWFLMLDTARHVLRKQAIVSICRSCGRPSAAYGWGIDGTSKDEE